MKKILVFALVILMLISCAACGKSDEDTEVPSFDLEAINKVYEIPAELASDVSENPIVYFSVSIGDMENIKSLTAYENESGACRVELIGDEKKIGNFVPEAFSCITAQFADCGLAAMDGQSVYEEGENYASMFVQFADGTFASADFSGTIPQEFTDGYANMESFFTKLTAELGEYVPCPVITGDIDEKVLGEVLDILARSGIENLDAFGINDILMDEHFEVVAGLTEREGIVNGTNCYPLMMTTPYSFIVVTAEDKSFIPEIREDFESNLDWGKWVCVFATDAFIAEKDNMVLCVMASDELFDKTLAAAESADWDNIVKIQNPDM